MKYLSSILILFIVGITTCTNAQNRSFNVGVQTGSIYDIGTGVIGQSNGVADVDLKGWKGDYAKFDLGYGLAASLDIKTRFALDFDILFGQITGQSEEQYYKSSLGMYTMGFRTYFRPHANASRLNAYVSLGIGMTSYDAKRYFVMDDGLFNTTQGVGFNNSVEVGTLIGLTKILKLQISSGILQTYSDALDGYDNLKAGDPIMRTKIGLVYSFKTGGIVEGEASEVDDKT